MLGQIARKDQRIDVCFYSFFGYMRRFAEANYAKTHQRNKATFGDRSKRRDTASTCAEEKMRDVVAAVTLSIRHREGVFPPAHINELNLFTQGYPGATPSSLFEC